MDKNKEIFFKYLVNTSAVGSGKPRSYIRALELVEIHLGINKIFQFGFNEIDKLKKIRTDIKNLNSIQGIPPSYLKNGYISASINSYISFIENKNAASGLIGIRKIPQRSKISHKKSFNNVNEFIEYYIDICSKFVDVNQLFELYTNNSPTLTARKFGVSVSHIYNSNKQFINYLNQVISNDEFIDLLEKNRRCIWEELSNDNYLSSKEESLVNNYQTLHIKNRLALAIYFSVKTNTTTFNKFKLLNLYLENFFTKMRNINMFFNNFYE